MLAVRIIPTILSKNGQLVKGKRFASDRVVGHALQASRIHNARGVDELCFLDVSATPEGRGPDLKLIEELTRDVFSPVTYGGGIRSVGGCPRSARGGGGQGVYLHRRNERRALLKPCAQHFRQSAIVVSIDVSEDWVVHVRVAAKSREDGSRPIGATHCEYGAGEILLQSIDRDGTLEGYDIDLIREVCQAVSIPVIASGGCSGSGDMLKAIHAGASACAAGALFAFTETTPRDCAKFLHTHGVEVRL
jgi:cyclase